MASAAGRLLIVDDDRDFAESLAELLDLSGYEVEAVHSGRQAVRRCRETRFDLTLMDLRMPGMDGVESFLEIRALRPDFRAILMTGHPVPGMLNRALAQGVRAVVRKPLSVEGLLALVEQHRSRRLVLVVDDDADFASSLAVVLEDSGYAVAVADSAESALRSAASERPELIVLDLRVPPSSGLEIHRELVRRGLDAPTVVVSAYVGEESEAVRTLRERTVAGVLQKPFATGDLLSILADLPRG